MNREEIIEKVSNALVQAGSTFREDKIKRYEEAIKIEDNENAKWALEQILENAKIAGASRGPLCDDTGIPHIFIEVGHQKSLTGDMLEAIQEGVKLGLHKLPGRPMAVLGNDLERLAQSKGMSENPSDLAPSPILIKNVDEDIIRVHILMLGGGPAIRAKTYRVFHKHDVHVVRDTIVNWANEVVGDLGCTPTTLAIGIGRSHFEASSMMMEAMVYGTYERQSELESYITDEVNKAQVGPLGLGGKTTVLGTFMKVGPQRASGVRIVCMRPCCCFEPRVGSVEL